MKQIASRIGRWFVAGVLALLPLIITLAVIAWVADFVKGIFGPSSLLGGLIQRVGLSVAPNSSLPYLLGTFFVLLLIFAVGVVVDSGAKTFWQRFVDGLFRRIPLVGDLYGTSQQVVSLLGKKEEGDLKKMKPVFCEFGGADGCGFLALLVSPAPFHLEGRDYVIVIVPTAPVPVGGGLLFVPADKVRETSLNVDGLMSIYVSMGLTANQFLCEEKKAK